MRETLHLSDPPATGISNIEFCGKCPEPSDSTGSPTATPTGSPTDDGSVSVGGDPHIMGFGHAWFDVRIDGAPHSIPLCLWAVKAHTLF